jgi:hypothetical protein
MNTGIFNTTGVKLAAVVLGLQALVALTYCMVMFIEGRVFAYAQSLGELLALAVSSPPTMAVQSREEGISDSAAGGKATSVRPKCLQYSFESLAADWG